MMCWICCKNKTRVDSSNGSYVFAKGYNIAKRFVTDKNLGHSLDSRIAHIITMYIGGGGGGGGC